MPAVPDTTGEGAVAAPPSLSVSPSPSPQGPEGQRIHFEDVSVRYGAVTVLSDFTLTVEPGEIVALLGPSGSGKTTALRAVAGFVAPTSGRVFIGQRDVTGIAPNARNIGMVVQNYALFPHMSVAENVAFGLRARRAERGLVARRVAESLALVGMEAFAGRMPRALSGGQQQRVAIARALAIRPSVLLLDEPLSALDAQIRRQMVEEIGRLHREIPDLTILYVTHDQHEALTLADRIAIMRDGKLAALDTARALYRRPPNRFSAEFLGRANVLEGRVSALSDDGTMAELEIGALRMRGANPHGLPAGARALIGLRPHHLTQALPHAGPGTSGAADGAVRIEGRITHVDWQGASETLTLALGPTSGGTTSGGTASGAASDPATAEIRCTAPPAAEPHRIGATITLHYDPQDATVLPHEATDG
ncbi:ABC transporter ATP-binding protein [Acidimangrovimonas sediminis]|uniref:ABC transporter ATP-binding protein n=1 Tax=Acidimangrovimonas sediminis TaxID=2056283 RepID=UPI000C807051|nr:ABC transporter ATP-binding protein [Acidimangrovimonas sediminis]